MNKLTKDQIEVLDEVSHIIDTEIIENLEEQYDEMSEKEFIQSMYEKGLGVW